MNTTDIPDLVQATETCALSLAQKVNQLHRERVANLIAERNTYAAKIERLQPELDNAHQAIAKLQLDVGILNGRLIERTEGMGERQREYLDRARKAEAAIERMACAITWAISNLESVRCLDSSDTMFKRDAIRLLGDAIKTAANCGQSADKPAEPAAPENL
jgi:chromosome segregation ATPase